MNKKKGLWWAPLDVIIKNMGLFCKTAIWCYERSIVNEDVLSCSISSCLRIHYYQADCLSLGESELIAYQCPCAIVERFIGFSIVVGLVCNSISNKYITWAALWFVCSCALSIEWELISTCLKSNLLISKALVLRSVEAYRYWVRTAMSVCALL